MKSLLAILATAAVLVFQSPLCWCGDCEDPASQASAADCCHGEEIPSDESCPLCGLAAWNRLGLGDQALFAPAPGTGDLTPDPPVARDILASSAISPGPPARLGEVLAEPAPVSRGALRSQLGVYLI